MFNSKKARLTVVIAVLVGLPPAAGTGPSTAPSDPANYDLNYEAMVIAPLSGDEVSQHAQAATMQPCLPGGIDTTRFIGAQMTCPDATYSLGSPTYCRLDSRIWYSYYVDASMTKYGKAQQYAAHFHSFISAVLDGENNHGVYQPNIPMCLNWAGQVPVSINAGFIDTTDDLNELAAYEAQFNDAGAFTVVLGYNKIQATGRSYGITLGDVRQGAPIMYYSWPGDEQWIGDRIGLHEIGHVFGADHSDCVNGMMDHEFIHTMGLSADRDPSCDPWSMHSHLAVFKGADAGAMDAAHEEWQNEH